LNFQEVVCLNKTEFRSIKQYLIQSVDEKYD